jgi:hypothetical protein
MSDDKLNIRSIDTAAAVMALTGVTPEILWRPGSDPTFRFPSETQPALQLYLEASDRLDRMVDEISP